MLNFRKIEIFTKPERRPTFTQPLEYRITILEGNILILFL